MKITMSRTSLLDLFFYVEYIMKKNKNAAFAQHKCIQFLFKEKILFLYACDGIHVCELSCTDFVADADYKDGSFLVEFSPMQDVIKLSTSENLLLNFAEKT